MGVRDTPSSSTTDNSTMRLPAGNWPLRISSRNPCCALTTCDPASSEEAGTRDEREANDMVRAGHVDAALYTLKAKNISICSIIEHILIFCMQ